MRIIYLVLLIIAAVLFAVAIAAPSTTAVAPDGRRWHRFNLVAAGLLAWVAVDLVRQFDLVVAD